MGPVWYGSDMGTLRVQYNLDMVWSERVLFSTVRVGFVRVLSGTISVLKFIFNFKTILFMGQRQKAYSLGRASIKKKILLSGHVR